MMKRTLKRGVALLLTVAMMTAMMSVCAFGESLSTTGKKVNIQQTITLDAHENVPNAEFVYEITPITTGAPEIADVVATFSAATNTVARDYTANAVIDLSGLTFPGYGVYSYTVAQKTVETGFTKDTGVLQLDVYVTNDSTEYGYVLKKGEEKVAGFTNVFDTYNLTVTKQITGNTAEMGKKFDFTIEINAGAVQAGDVLQTSVAGTTITLDATGAATVTGVKLGNNESITIYGLVPSADISYTVTETDGNGYETTINGTADDDRVITKKMAGNANATVTYVNNSETATPTGIILTFAPYVLMVLGAAAIGFVFFRRRQHDC